MFTKPTIYAFPNYMNINFGKIENKFKNMLVYYETEISKSVGNEFQCKTNIFHGFTVLTKLADLLIISFPHFRNKPLFFMIDS